MRLIHSKYNEPFISLGLLIIRVMAGSTMLVNHGLKKITTFDTLVESGFADPFHIGSHASLYLTIFAEAVCAGLIILGLVCRLATIPLIIAMTVALFYAHNGQIFGNGESAGVFLAIFLGLLCTGPGKYSVDRMIGK